MWNSELTLIYYYVYFSKFRYKDGEYQKERNEEERSKSYLRALSLLCVILKRKKKLLTLQVVQPDIKS